MTLAGAFAHEVPRAGERVRFRAADAGDAGHARRSCLRPAWPNSGSFSAKAMHAALRFAAGVSVALRALLVAPASCRSRRRRHRARRDGDPRRQQTMFDDVHRVGTGALFGVCRTIGQLLRGLILETEIPAPKRSQILVAHCATDERKRGTGVFSALFRDALDTGALPADGSRDVVLDVLTRNVRARCTSGWGSLHCRGHAPVRAGCPPNSIRSGWVFSPRLTASIACRLTCRRPNSWRSSLASCASVVAIRSNSTPTRVG